MMQLTKQKNVAIWDFDGSIADSEYWHLSSYQKIFDEFELKIDPEYYMREIAYHGGGAERLAIDFSLPISAKELKDRKRKNYTDFIEQGLISVFEEIPAIIHSQKELGMRLIIASNSPEHMNRAILASSKIDPDLFDIYLAPSKDLPRKPKPDMFLLALNQAKTEAKDAVVFEDTKIGVEASVGAGIDPVFLRSKHNAPLPTPEGALDYDHQLLKEFYAR